MQLPGSSPTWEPTPFTSCDQPPHLVKKCSVSDVIRRCAQVRFIDQESWDAVRARKAARQGWSYQAQRRPKRLLSGIAQCGLCVGPFVVTGSDKWGCANARRAGTCSNRRRIDNPVLEDRVVSGRRRELLDPDRMKRDSVAYYGDRAQYEREQKAAAARAGRRVEQLQATIDRLVAAVTAGAGAGDIPEIVQALHRAPSAPSSSTRSARPRRRRSPSCTPRSMTPIASPSTISL